MLIFVLPVSEVAIGFIHFHMLALSIPVMSIIVNTPVVEESIDYFTIGVISDAGPKWHIFAKMTHLGSRNDF